MSKRKNCIQIIICFPLCSSSRKRVFFFFFFYRRVERSSRARVLAPAIIRITKGTQRQSSYIYYQVALVSIHYASYMECEMDTLGVLTTRSHLRIVSCLSVKVERINVFWPKPDLSHLIKPGFDLAFEFWFLASWTRLVKRPSCRYILANAAESICYQQWE